MMTVVRVGSTNYTAWHVWTNLTTTSPSGSTTFTIDTWVTTEGLKVLKSRSVYPSAGTVTSIYSPPQPALVFPLTPGANWDGNTTVTTTTNLGTTTNTVAWSGRVVSEVSVTVPAGTFDTAVVRSPTTGGAYVLVYYAQAAGWAVKLESYDNRSMLADSFQLTSYDYRLPATGGTSPPLYWILLAVAVASVVVVAVLLLQRKRRKAAPTGTAILARPPPGGPSEPPPEGK
jgi:hypothetical protein